MRPHLVAASQQELASTCSRWIPSGEEKESKKGREAYQRIMDLPEAKEADWSKIPQAEILKLNRWFQTIKDYNYHWLLEVVRSTLTIDERER
jgi:hypothetical protein